MVKISKSTGQRKHGPAKESVSKSNPRRKAASDQRSSSVVAAGENTAKAEASTNPRQQMPRTRDWRYRDTFDPGEQGGDDGDLPEQWDPDRLEAGQHEPAQRKPQQEPRPLLTCQSSVYLQPSPDDHDEAWPEAGEPVDEHADDGDEDADYDDDGEYTDDGDQDDDSVNYITDEIEGSEYRDDEEYSNYGEDEDCLDDGDQQGPAREEEVGVFDAPPAEQEPVKIHWLMTKLKKKDRGTFVFRMVREIVDTGDQAMVLGQIMYWFDHGPNGKPRAGTLKKGKRWLFKSHAEFSIELGIPERRIRTCISHLKNRGLIELAYFRANGQRTTHIRLNVTAVYEAMLKTGQKRRENPDATVSVARSD